MLLKFTSPDMLNTTLVDVATDKCKYNIVTLPISISTLTEQKNPPSIDSCTPLASTSNIRSPTVVGSSPSFMKKQSPCESDTSSNDQRRTTISDASGTILAEVDWKGRRPTITIGEEKVGPLTDLFGSSTVRFMPKILVIPTRFDTEYIWTATPDSLTLFDYDTETVKGTFHQNSIRIPLFSKGSQFSHPSISSTKAFSKSAELLSTPSPISTTRAENVLQDETRSRSRFIPTHVPGIGSNFLEFSSHPLAQDVEIILSFLMMEILRRGRFGLTLYTFEKPKLWQLKEARHQFIRRLRRNMV